MAQNKTHDAPAGPGAMLMPRSSTGGTNRSASEERGWHAVLQQAQLPPDEEAEAGPERRAELDALAGRSCWGGDWTGKILSFKEGPTARAPIFLARILSLNPSSTHYTRSSPGTGGSAESVP